MKSALVFSSMLKQQLRPQTISRSPVMRCRMATDAAAVLKPAAAISTPKLRDIDQRWSSLSVAEQNELVSEIRERMKAPWNQLSKAEKDAAYWLAYGNYGTRELQDYEKPGFYTRVIAIAAVTVSFGLGLFALIRYYGQPSPHTLTKEWQEATNERLRKHNSDPITGVSSKGYTVKGHVQSK